MKHYFTLVEIFQDETVVRGAASTTDATNKNANVFGESVKKTRTFLNITTILLKKFRNKNRNNKSNSDSLGYFISVL